MKFVDEYRDADIAKKLSAEIASLSGGRPLKLMEVCGGHTHTIYKYGIEDVLNFFVFCNHVMILPAIKALLDSPDLRLDGFIGPGHVSTIIGCEPYRFIAEQCGKPVVMSGFEPLDVIQSVYMLVKQIVEG